MKVLKRYGFRVLLKKENKIIIRWMMHKKTSQNERFGVRYILQQQFHTRLHLEGW